MATYCAMGYARHMPLQIESPDDEALNRLCSELASRADALDGSGGWPAEQLRLCGEAGVFRWLRLVAARSTAIHSAVAACWNCAMSSLMNNSMVAQ